MGCTCVHWVRSLTFSVVGFLVLFFIVDLTTSPAHAQSAPSADCRAMGKSCFKETKLLRKLKKKLLKLNERLAKYQTKVQTKIGRIDEKIAAIQTAITAAGQDQAQIVYLQRKLEGLNAKKTRTLSIAEVKLNKINTAIAALETLITNQRAKRVESCLNFATFCQMPENVLTNSSFADESHWSVWSRPWATEEDSRSFEVDPSNKMAIVRTSLLGNRSINQYFKNVFLETDAISVKLDVNVQKIVEAQGGGYIGATLYSYWDSNDDVDYCSSPAGGFDYSKTCASDIDCPGQVCQKFSWFFCKDPAGSWTNEPCNEGRFINTRCEARFGPGSICTDVGSVNDVSSSRDYVTIHTLNADLNIRNEWQSLSRWITLGAQGAARPLIGCNLALNVEDGFVQDGSSSNPMLLRPTLPNHSVGQICNTSDQWDLGCQKTVCRLPGADGILDTADDTNGATECTFATSSETGASPNGICPGGQQCGGESEAWFRSPVLTMLRIQPE